MNPNFKIPTTILQPIDTMRLTMKQKSDDEKCHVHIVMHLWVLIQTLLMDEF
jgi:hypothetical protein